VIQVAPEGEGTLAHKLGNVVIHLIFSTKDRQPLIAPSFKSDLFAYLGGIVREMQATALIINGTEDHVHMLVRVRPAHSIAEVARIVKTNSSRSVHEKWSPAFAWQTGYGAFSVSESNIAGVTRYIAAQEEHHREFISGGLSIIPEKEQCALRRSAFVGLSSFARRGFGFQRRTHGLRRGLYSYAALRLVAF
jgi:putative transposase